MAFRDEQGADPVTVVGNYALLTPAVSFGYALSPDRIRNSTGLSLGAIPDNPSLAGSVMLFQYWFVMPDLSVVYSDVFGTQILGGGASFLGEGQQEARDAWLSGLRKRPNCMSEEDMQALTNRLLLRLRSGG